MTETVRIGRRGRVGPMRPCCTITRDSKTGLITFSDADEDQGPSTAEQRELLDHFTRPLKDISGAVVDGRIVDTVVTLNPDHPDYFLAATYQLPLPFARMP